MGAARYVPVVRSQPRREAWPTTVLASRAALPPPRRWSNPALGVVTGTARYSVLAGCASVPAVRLVQGMAD
jgi:hypothetical protein